MSRSPHGERGLKYGLAVGIDVVCESLSSWRAWIEIGPTSRLTVPSGRSPHGERGLKLDAVAGREKDQVALLMESVD